MHLRDLYVIHASKRARDSHDAKPEPGFFELETCQRRLWIGAARPAQPALEGEEAYRFLLQVGCGLESEVVGETDVFGQLKQAWQRFEAEGSALSRRLRPWMQRLFEDVKDIRSRYLENLGGQSYGTLVRALVAPLEGENVLVVGAGNIAASIVPYLTHARLSIWNRSETPARALAGANVRASWGAEAEAAAWLAARHVIVCIPADPAQDAGRAALWARNTHGGILLHLGCYKDRPEARGWLGAARFHALDDLFALRETQSQARDVRVEQARRACRERARLRALGGSICLAHGWEDLASFI